MACAEIAQSIRVCVATRRMVTRKYTAQEVYRTVINNSNIANNNAKLLHPNKAAQILPGPHIFDLFQD